MIARCPPRGSTAGLKTKREFQTGHPRCRTVAVPGEGLANVTVEAIAARPAPANRTIYRWWPSKGAVMLDALEAVAARIPTADTGECLLTCEPSRQVVELYADESSDPISLHYRSSPARPGLLADFLERYLKPRRAEAVDRLKSRKTESTPRRSETSDDISDVIFGAGLPTPASSKTGR